MKTEQRDIELRIDGQRFRFAGALTTTNAPDAYVVLTARCIDCGAAFLQIVTPSQIGAAALMRRCEPHRHPRILRLPLLVHHAALEQPPAIGDLQHAPPARDCTPTRMSLHKADLSAVVLRRHKKRATTARDFLALIADGWPGLGKLGDLLGTTSKSSVSRTTDRVIAAGWLQRVGAGVDTKYVLTAAGQAAVAGIKEAKRGE